MLQHDQVRLARLILHQTFQSATKRVQKVDRRSARDDFLRAREQADPFEARDDTVRLSLVRECYELLDLRNKSCFIRCRCASGLLHDLGKAQPLDQPFLLLILEPTQFHQRADEFGEALIPQCPTDNCFGLGDIVKLAEGRRITVRVRDKRVGGGDVVRFRVRHKFAA